MSNLDYAEDLILGSFDDPQYNLFLDKYGGNDKLMSPWYNYKEGKSEHEEDIAGVFGNGVDSDNSTNIVDYIKDDSDSDINIADESENDDILTDRIDDDIIGNGEDTDINMFSRENNLNIDEDIAPDSDDEFEIDTLEDDTELSDDDIESDYGIDSEEDEDDDSDIEDLSD